jgi:hypothetical protein
MKLFGSGLVLACSIGLTLQATAAEVLHYTLVRGSTITPRDGASPIGPTEPLRGHFDWLQYDGPINETILAFNAVALTFHSPSFTLQLNTSPANDIMSALHTDSNLTVFDEVADLTGLASSPGSVSSLSPGSYLGPPTRPVVLNYPNVGVAPVGGGAWLANLNLVAVMDEALNVAPSFVKGPDVTVLQNCGLQMVSGWATSISAGPPNEAWQTLTFIVTVNDSVLFSVPPAITPDGTLSFTPALNHSGEALVTVVLHDNGGTDYGGQDTSDPQNFSITVLSPCQAVEQLAQSILQADLGNFNKRPLLASLRAAFVAFQQGDWQKGSQQLEVFQTKVRVQLGPTVPGLAGLWIAAAQDIVESVNAVPGNIEHQTMSRVALPEL